MEKAMRSFWNQTKLDLSKKHKFLAPFIVTVESATLDRINHLLKMGDIEKYPYEPLLIDSLLSDCSILLDRCLSYRKEARDFEVEAVTFAMEYEKSIEIIDIEERMDHDTSEESLLLAEAKLLKSASEQFGSVADLGPGFSTQAKSASDGSASRSQIWSCRIGALDERRAALRKWQDTYMARHNAPGAAHNYVERMSRLVEFLAEDLFEVHCKAGALFEGVQRIFGRKIDLPPLGEGVLDKLVNSVRRTSRFLDAQKQNEIAYDLVIPLCQPWNVGEVALVDVKRLLEYGKNPDKAPITFDLHNVFFNQTAIRIKSVGLSFGNTQEHTTTSNSKSRSTQWGSSGDTDTTGTGDSSSLSAILAKYRIRATIHTPQQEGVSGIKYYRPPVVLGNFSVFGGGAAVAIESGDSCKNIDPSSGEWKIFIENSAVHSGPDAINVFDKKGRSFIEDLKLHLRVVSVFVTGDSAFRPIREPRLRRRRKE